MRIWQKLQWYDSVHYKMFKFKFCATNCIGNDFSTLISSTHSCFWRKLFNYAWEVRGLIKINGRINSQFISSCVKRTYCNDRIRCRCPVSLSFRFRLSVNGWMAIWPYKVIWIRSTICHSYSKIKYFLFWNVWPNFNKKGIKISEEPNGNSAIHKTFSHSHSNSNIQISSIQTHTRFDRGGSRILHNGGGGGTSLPEEANYVSRSRIFPDGEALTYNLAKFCRKPHENKDNLTGTCPKFYYVDPPLTYDLPKFSTKLYEI